MSGELLEHTPVLCPICFKQFPLIDIEAHSDACVDNNQEQQQKVEVEVEQLAASNLKQEENKQEEEDEEEDWVSVKPSDYL
jgi:hypothetical protein